MSFSSSLKWKDYWHLSDTSCLSGPVCICFNTKWKIHSQSKHSNCHYTICSLYNMLINLTVILYLSSSDNVNANQISWQLERRTGRYVPETLHSHISSKPNSVRTALLLFSQYNMLVFGVLRGIIYSPLRRFRAVNLCYSQMQFVRKR